MADLFSLSEEQWAVVGRFMPINQPGARRVDDRRVVSGILRMLCTGGRWRGVPAVLAEAGWIARTAAIDSTDTEAHRCAHGGKGRRGRRRSAPRGAGRPPRSTSCPTSSAAPPSSNSPQATAAT